MENQIHTMLHWLIPVIIVTGIWDTTWKLIAMWKAAGKKQLAWYICIAIFNTIGILPIIYILLNREKE
ncbi:MAG: DUF5652 family protein [Bacteroidales bacterium]|jgi:hypothetical protein